MKLILVAGARPNFMKIAPLIRQLKVESEKLKVLSQKTNDKRLPRLPRKEERQYWGEMSHLTRLPNGIQSLFLRGGSNYSTGGLFNCGLMTIDYLLVHTGQHYDYEMSKVFFEDLEIPEPDVIVNIYEEKG